MPAGWEVRMTQSDTPYYFHAALNKRQFEKPEMDKDLPDGVGVFLRSLNELGWAQESLQQKLQTGSVRKLARRVRSSGRLTALCNLDIPSWGLPWPCRFVA